MRSKNNAAESPTSARLIETDEFPFEFLSSLAERESWRKEIYRPVYHIHKWWAKRLGSVFRGILLGCLLPRGADLKRSFYEGHDFSGVTVFDPFMGSGTTVGEAHKLGCHALGRDINPVACESVRVALGPLDRTLLTAAFEDLSATVGGRVRDLYRASDEKGRARDVLYYFWVKQAVCPQCQRLVDLFPSRVFAKNANPAKKPEVQVCCPVCSEVFSASRRDEVVHCRSCRGSFDPHRGVACGAKANCPHCQGEFAIAQAVRAAQGPPSHRLYAKLLLCPDGTKRYVAATDDDRAAYADCSRRLADELASGSVRLPTAVLAEGYNTRQAIGYNYHRWRDFFNDRQLLALGWLQEAIARLPEPSVRDALQLLFSGLLEFNNLFASYKGEGTGAVRHMFSHHILKPERLPIEANVWGTPKSSGSFRNLFASRLLRAIEYRRTPFEVRHDGDGKAYTEGESFTGTVETTWSAQAPTQRKAICLSCGSSDETGLPEGSVDLVVTDPPFFDNVHYSELADFFQAWQTLYPRGFITNQATTRNPREVQDTRADKFAEKLGRVFAECRRLLKDDGLLVFTYHHSRKEGWTSLAQAVCESGFSAVRAHPVKAEMSVATPKSLAKEPIQLDIVFVCQKHERDHRLAQSPEMTLAATAAMAVDQLRRLRRLGLNLSVNDCRVCVHSQFLALLGPAQSPQHAVNAFNTCRDELERMATKICEEAARALPEKELPSKGKQLPLFS